MREPSREIRFDPIEWENLVEFLKDCPGRICAAIVPGIDGGNALLEQLPDELAPVPVHPASNEAEPAQLGHRAVELGKSDAVFLIVLDGRRRFDSDEERDAFWQALNFQRESLASGRLRTCFVLNQLNDGWMMRCADDLREWVRIFRFPEAFVRRDDLPLIMQTEDWKRFISDFSVPVPLDPLRDQLRRAREAGFSRDQLARDYAAPLFEALVVRGYLDEAKKIWHEDLYDGDALGNLPAEEQFGLYKMRFNQALIEGDHKEASHCSERMLAVSRSEIVSISLRDEMMLDSLLTHGVLLGLENMNQEALATFDEIIGKYSNDNNRIFEESLAAAFWYKALALHRLQRNDEALSTCDESITRFGDKPGLGIGFQLARIFLLKISILFEVGRMEEALGICDEFRRCFGEDSSPDMREIIAAVFFDKGAILGVLGQNEEAIDVYDEVVNRFGEDINPEVEKQVAKAMVNKGFALLTLGREEDALRVYNEVVNRFGADADPDIKESIARALYSKSNLLIQRWYRSRDPKILDQSLAAGRRAVELGGQHYNYACALALSGQHEEAFRQLEIALKNNEIPWTHVAEDLDWNPLQDDPRYVELKDRFGRDITLKTED